MLSEVAPSILEAGLGINPSPRQMMPGQAPAKKPKKLYFFWLCVPSTRLKQNNVTPIIEPHPTMMKTHPPKFNPACTILASV
jgi:hypothetical protein